MHHDQLKHYHAHMLISSELDGKTHIIKTLQKLMCSSAVNHTECRTCIMIDQKNHPQILWFYPEDKHYSLEQIDTIIALCQFQLQTDETRFFILMQAHELTQAGNNRLLKLIEEPYPGYTFIFVSPRKHDILPTLLSRCFVHHLSQQNHPSGLHDLIPFFTQIKTEFNPLAFLKTIEKNNLKDNAVQEVLDILLEHFYQKLREAIQQNNISNQTLYVHYSALIKEQYSQLPVSGSYKLFWKNFYIAFHYQTLCLKS